MSDKNKTTKIIWVDLDNSPHVPLFIPIIRELESRGNKVIITARDFAQTVELLKKTNLSFSVIGSHYGKNKFLKVFGLFIRAFQLFRFIKKHKVNIAMNHGSRSQTITCWLLRIPVFCGLDYEHTESYIFSYFATRLWVPEGISEEGIKAICSNKNKIFRYKGYKEEIYLKDFIPENEFRKNLGIDENKILVILRPPATQANYHNVQSEKLLIGLINFLKTNPNVHTICLPRTKTQGRELRKYISEKFSIPDGVIDGMNVAFHSDLVISGGGTMNREAALLGTPVYSIFSGKLGSLDDYMQKNSLIKFIRGINDIMGIELKKKNEKDKYIINKNLVNLLSDELLGLT